MPDYGHPLCFGTFIGPTNSPPSRPVELAQLSERLGFDFVTFQDHPYQSSFLDTWTLLSWVAARTERIGVFGNVLNLPLRQPPAVLARAAASLDLLSGGRTSLGLGAGFFWDAVQAIGGRRLTPLQGVAALDEAIDIIAGSGMPTGSAAWTLTASSTRSRAPSVDPRPPMRSRSGSAPTSRRCRGWWGANPMVGCRRCRC
jgi:alkanesulfonate monooxygenase SsuD/methylene tetrahydromethanopterin reductase-like flavin-dependent oxidoreductase (luciferase family)